MMSQETLCDGPFQKEYKTFYARIFSHGAY